MSSSRTRMVCGSVAAFAFCCSLISCRDDGSRYAPTTTQASSAVAAAVSFAGSDYDQPLVDVRYPLRGAYLDALSNPGHDVQVRGSASDATTAVVSVAVNGVPATLDANGEFSVVVPLLVGANSLVVEAVDQAGNVGQTVQSVVFAESFDQGLHPLQHGLAVRLTDPGLQAMASGVISAVVQTGALTTLLQNGGQPIWKDHQYMPSWLGGGCIASLAVTVRGVSFDTPTLQLDARPGELFASVKVPNLRVDVVGDDYCGLPWPAVTGNLVASRVHASMGLSLHVDPATGDMVATARQSQVTFTGFDVQFTNLPGQILGAFSVASSLEAPIADAIAAALTDELPKALEDEINAFFKPVTSTWRGQSMVVSIEPTTVSFDHDGLSMMCATDAQGTLAPGLPAVPGAFFQPQHGSAWPPLPASNPHLTLAVLTNAWNRALYASWQAGFWNLQIDQAFLQAAGSSVPFALDTSLLQRYVPGIGSVLTNTTTTSVPIALEIKPMAQPIVLATPGGPNLLRLQLPELHLGILIDPGTGFTKLWEFAIHAEIGVDFQVLAGSQLAVSIGGSPRFDAQLLNSAVNMRGLDVSRFLSFLVPSILQVVGQSMGPFPLPAVGANNGIILRTPSLRIDGAHDDYLFIEGDV